LSFLLNSNLGQPRPKRRRDRSPEEDRGRKRSCTGPPHSHQHQRQRRRDPTPEPPPPPAPPPPTAPAAAGRNPRDEDPGSTSRRWQQQLQTWDNICKRFGILPDRYVDFQYILYLDIEDKFVQNYVRFHLGLEKPVIKHRLKNHLQFWKRLNTPPWLLEVIDKGFSIPFHTLPPSMNL